MRDDHWFNFTVPLTESRRGSTIIIYVLSAL
jgi:hypothetical protein